MEGMTAPCRVGFDVIGLRVVVTRMPAPAGGEHGYAADLCRGDLVARGRLVRHGNACCLEVAEAPGWLRRLCAGAPAVTDGETVWVEVPPLVRAELVLPWLQSHRRTSPPQAA